MAESVFDDFEMNQMEKNQEYADAETESEISDLLESRYILAEKVKNSDNAYSKFKYITRINDINKKLKLENRLDRFSYTALEKYYDENNKYLTKLKEERNSLTEESMSKSLIVEEIKKIEKSLADINTELKKETILKITVTH